MRLHVSHFFCIFYRKSSNNDGKTVRDILMTKSNSNILYRLLNISFAFAALCLISSYLSHWPNVTYHSWINEIIYFFLFLLTVSIFVRDKHNKDIFGNLGILLLAYSFSFINIFIGETYVFGNNYTLYYFFAYKKIILCFLLNFTIIYIALKYLFLKKKKWTIYLLSLLILTPIYFVHFYAYIRNPQFIFTLGQNFFMDINRRVFMTYGLSLFSILLYGYILYKRDKPIGTYINSLMAFFFVFLISEMIDSLSQVYGYQIFSLGQWVLTLNLVFLCIILFKKLFFLCSEYGQFYEDILQSKGKLGKVRIMRHQNKGNAIFLHFLTYYLYHRRNYILMLCFLTAVGIFYFKFPKFFTINIVAFVCCSTVLLWFLTGLYRRRAQKKFILQQE